MLVFNHKMRRGWVALAIMWLSILCLAAIPANFSGKYSLLENGKNASPNPEPNLFVVQTADSIEVTKVENGKKIVNTYPLDGAEGDYITSSGVKGKCKAKFKGSNLILESAVVNRVQMQGHPSTPVRMQTKEQWQLSSDAKLLSVKWEVSFPDFADMAAAVNKSGKEKYIRVAN
jgi:hypothetical protein